MPGKLTAGWAHAAAVKALSASMMAASCPTACSSIRRQQKRRNSMSPLRRYRATKHIERRRGKRKIRQRRFFENAKLLDAAPSRVGLRRIIAKPHGLVLL